MTTPNHPPVAVTAVGGCWLNKPIAPCQLYPDGLSGLLLAMRHSDRSVGLGDVFLVTLRTDRTRQVSGYTVARPNRRTFEFEGALPEPAAIVQAVQALDPPAPLAPMLPFRSAADYAANDPDAYYRQCEDLDGPGPDNAV